MYERERERERESVCVYVCVGFFPTNTSWLSYNLTQFWHYLPGYRPRFHRLMAQSQRLPSSSDACHKVRLLPVLLTDWLYIRGSHDPLLEFKSLARMAHGTQEKTVCSLACGLITKDIKEYESIARWGKTQGKVGGKGVVFPCPLRVCHVFTNPEALPTLCSGFLWWLLFIVTSDYITGHGWLIQPPGPLPFPETEMGVSQGGTEVPTL